MKNNKFVDIIINGVPLLDTIKQIEAVYCQQEGTPEIAGDYGHNTAEYMKKRLNEALIPDTYSYNGVNLYCCMDAVFAVAGRCAVLSVKKTVL